MSIVSKMLSRKKLGPIMEIDFPPEEPEFKLKFQRPSVGEMSFTGLEAFKRAERYGQDSTAQAVGMVEVYGDKLREKLVDWECELVPFNKENKDVFIDSLDTEKLSTLIGLYLKEASLEGEELGNGTALVKASSKRSKKD